MSVYWTTMNSPLGPIRVASSHVGLCAVGLPGESEERFLETCQSRLGSAVVEGEEPNHEALGQLQAYFGGCLRDFALPLDLRGTDFQVAVWRELMRIPYGATRTYGEVADAVGRPRACRAVGAANSRNLVPIVVPCHRVIGSGGGLVGFGGGLELKGWLLQLESPLAQRWSS